MPAPVLHFSSGKPPQNPSGVDTRAAMPQFLAAFATVAASDATATVTEGLAGSFAEVFGLAIHAPPVALDPFQLSLLRSAGGPPDPAIDGLEATVVGAREAV